MKLELHPWKSSFIFYFLFFLREREKEFQPMASTLDDSSLSSNQDMNQFWCKRGLNPISVIQPSEILPVELIETHMKVEFNMEDGDY